LLTHAEGQLGISSNFLYQVLIVLAFRVRRIKLYCLS